MSPSPVDVSAVIVKMTDLLDAPSIAVTVALCPETNAFEAAEVIVAVAANIAVVAPDCTTTDAGTVRADAWLLKSDTVVPPVGAALEIVTLQVVEAEAPRLVLPHCSDV